MANIHVELEAQRDKIKEAEQRYQEAERACDPLKMKAAIDDIADIQKTIQRLQRDESQRRVEALRDQALAEQRRKRDESADLAKLEYEQAKALRRLKRDEEAKGRD